VAVRAVLPGNPGKTLKKIQIKIHTYNERGKIRAKNPDKVTKSKNHQNIG